MPGVVADTHALVWYLIEPARLSNAASAALDASVNSGEKIYVSAISLVELIYLVEKGRLPQLVITRLQAALAVAGAEVSVVPLDQQLAWHVDQVPRASVPELPDRVIAATASFLKLPLVTRDAKIRSAGLVTVW